MHKNELLSFQQKQSIIKSKRKIFYRKAADYYLQNKEKIK